ncbi:hypothetical protein ACLOJK_009174 [Asimina triloba]
MAHLIAADLGRTIWTRSWQAAVNTGGGGRSSLAGVGSGGSGSKEADGNVGRSLADGGDVDGNVVDGGDVDDSVVDGLGLASVDDEEDAFDGIDDGVVEIFKWHESAPKGMSLLATERESSPRVATMDAVDMHRRQICDVLAVAGKMDDLDGPMGHSPSVGFRQWRRRLSKAAFDGVGHRQQ